MQAFVASPHRMEFRDAILAPRQSRRPIWRLMPVFRQWRQIVLAADDEDATPEPVQSLGRAPLYQCRDDAKVTGGRHGADNASGPVAKRALPWLRKHSRRTEPAHQFHADKWINSTGMRASSHLFKCRADNSSNC